MTMDWLRAWVLIAASSGSLVAAGAVVGEGKEFPPGSLIAGVPAKVLGTVGDELRERMRQGAAHYVALAASYRRRGLAARPVGHPPAYLGLGPLGSPEIA